LVAVVEVLEVANSTRVKVMAHSLAAAVVAQDAFT
jgi:hypothetical protein